LAPRTGLEPATSLLRRRPPRDLDRLLSCRYPRRVAHDNTVRVGPRWAQIPPGPGGRSSVGCRVEVRELLDGRLVVLYQERCLTTLPSPGPAFILRPRAPARPPRSLSASRRSDPDGGRSLPPPRNRPSDTAQRPSVLCHAGAHASLAHHLFTSPPRPRGDGPEGMTFSRNS